MKRKKKNKPLLKNSLPLKKIKGEPLTSVIPYYPHKIMVEDSLLVVLNRKGKNFFQIYSSNTMELLTEFGSNGRGPGEFNEPTFINQKNNIEGKSYHVIYDRIKKTISYINFKEHLNDNSTIDKNETLPPRMKASRFVYHSDTLSITVPGDEVAGRFLMQRVSGTEIVDYLPKLPFKVYKDNYYYLYANKSSLVNIDKGKFVGSLPMLGQYDFFDFSGNF